MSGGDEPGDRGGEGPALSGWATKGSGQVGGRADPSLGASWMPVRPVLFGALHPKEYSTRLT